MLPWSPAAQRFKDNPGADERLTQSSGFGGQYKYVRILGTSPSSDSIDANC